MLLELRTFEKRDTPQTPTFSDSCITMISIQFVFVSLTAFTVVLGNMPYKSSREEKVINLQESPALKIAELESSLMGEGTNNLNALVNENQGAIPLPQGAGILHRFRRTTRECVITVQKTEHQKGSCIMLAGDTPACQNDHYLAIDGSC